MSISARKIINKTFKWLVRILAFLLLLLLFVFVALQTQWGKNIVKREAVKYLEHKLKTKVAIAELEIDWLSHIRIKGIDLEDRQQRKLLQAEEIDIHYNLSKILKNELTISQLSLTGIRINLIRERQDPLFNFYFIPAAFAGEPSSEPKPESKSSFKFNLGTINLKSIDFMMNDQYGGQVYKANLGSLTTKMGKMDLDHMAFNLPYLFTDAVRCDIFMFAPYKMADANGSSKSNGSGAFSINIDTVALANSQFLMNDSLSKMNIQSIAGLIATGKLNFDLSKMHAAIASASVYEHKTSVAITSVAQKETVAKSIDSSQASNPFSFEIGQIKLDKNEIHFDDQAASVSKEKKMDFNHLAFTQIVLNAHNTSYDGKTYSSEIDQFNVTEKSGFTVKKLKTKASYGDTSVQLTGLELETLQNLIEGDMSISYASAASMLTKPSQTKINLNLKKTNLLLDELLLFEPSLAKNNSFRPLLGKRFFIQTKANGTLNRLLIPQLQIKEANLLLLAKAGVYELPDIKKLKIDLELLSFNGNRKDLLSLLPKGILPDSMLHYIPERFTLKGQYKGTLNDMQTNLKLNTSSGDIAIRGNLKNITDANKATYDLDVNADALQVGKILQDTMFGNVSASVKVKGKGYNLASADLDFDAAIRSAGFKGYKYTGVQAKGSFHKNILDANLLSTDPNITFSSDTYLDLNSVHRSFKTNTVIEYADLQKLGFMQDTFQLSGKINADFPFLDTAKLIGNLLANDIHFKYGTNKIILDSLSIDATNDDSTQVINLKSPFANLNLRGNYDLMSIPSAIKTVANKYIYTTSNDTMYTRRVQAILNGQVNIPDSFLFLIPGLKVISPFEITAFLNTDSSAIGLVTNIHKIVYDQYDMDSLAIVALNNPSDEKFKNLTYLFSLGKIASPLINLEKSEIRGNIKKGIITGKVNLKDEFGNARYIVPYEITNHPVLPYIKIGDSLMINKKYWSANADNIIHMNVDFLKGSNLVLSNENESISIKADSSQTNGLPLELSLHQFRLKNISEIMTTDTTLVEGLANGKVRLQSFEPIAFSSDLQIDSLRLKEINAGNLSVKINQQTEDLLDANISLLGMKNDIKIAGDYDIKAKNLELKLNMNYFNLQSIEPFMGDYLSKVRGGIKGNLNISGTLTDPKVVGELKTDSAWAIYKEYGTYLMLPNEALTFDNGEIVFNNFHFLDSAGHQGEVNGSFRMEGLTHFNYDAKIKANNFRVVGSKQYPEQQIYGPASADATINLTGTEEKLKVDGEVKVTDNSALTYIYASNDVAREGDGLIEFFDPAHPENDSIALTKVKKKSNPMQMLLNMNISTTPKSTVTIVLDEMSGDQLKIAGKADLNFSMNPGGQMQMTGKYTVESGDYDLSIAQLIKKKFSIEKGSSISWSGDLMKAQMDIKALYKVKTTAGELMNGSSSAQGIDKQKLNFEVYLLLSKDLLKPDIGFKLDMPENEQQVFDGAVYTRLKQINTIPSELNKQVMALLAINHFIADNPLNSISSAGNESLETRAFATAGNLLTQELSDLVSSAIKGVDIDIALDVNEDYTTGKSERNTDLKVGVTKSIANNRLIIYVGSSIALEGQNQSSDALSGLAGDVTLEYLLSKDGKYRIKGFRVNENELSLQGEIVKTGVTFVVVLEFNKIKTVFKKKKKK
jgi:autotransporter translocation and assembly factor TamB